MDDEKRTPWGPQRSNEASPAMSDDELRTHKTWAATAKVFGFNELAKLGKTLGEKVYARLARDYAEQDLVALGGTKILAADDEPTVLELPMSNPPHIRFRASDIELMREAVRVHDAEHPRTDSASLSEYEKGMARERERVVAYLRCIVGDHCAADGIENAFHMSSFDETTKPRTEPASPHDYDACGDYTGAECDRARDEERAAIVAWLRNWTLSTQGTDDYAAALHDVAARLENGDWRKRERRDVADPGDECGHTCDLHRRESALPTNDIQDYWFQHGRNSSIKELLALRKVAEAARAVVKGYGPYSSWGALEHDLYDALTALPSSKGES